MDSLQQETEVHFTLAHSAPISKTLLGEKLCYLSDEAVALDIVLGRYEIPDDMDEATALILRKIGKMGMKISTGDGRQLIVLPTDFKSSGVVSESTPPPLLQPCITVTTKQQTTQK